MKEKCASCGGGIKVGTVPRYKTLQFGIPLILKDAVVTESCECDTQVTIPNIAGLVVAAAAVRATEPQKLVGCEIKFLRKAIGIAAKQMAAKLGVTPEAFSRWENDKAPMNGNSERMLRALVVLDLPERAETLGVLRKVMDMEIAGMARPDQPMELMFSLSKDTAGDYISLPERKRA